MKRKTCPVVDFAAPTTHKVKLKESKKKDKYLDLAREKNKQIVKHESDADTNYNWCTWKIPKGLVKGLEKLEVRGKVKNVHTIALVRSIRVLRQVLETLGNLLSLKPQ